jgi:hypothetical protein
MAVALFVFTALGAPGLALNLDQAASGIAAATRLAPGRNRDLTTTWELDVAGAHH